MLHLLVCEKALQTSTLERNDTRWSGMNMTNRLIHPLLRKVLDSLTIKTLRTLIWLASYNG